MNKKNLEKFAREVEDSTNETLNDSLLDEDYNSVDIDYNDIASNSTKERMGKVPWLVAIFLVFILSITLVYMFLNNNPQTIFTMAIDKFFESASSKITDNAYSISKGKVDIKLDLNNDGDYKELFSEISKNDYSFDYVIDNSNNLSFIKFLLNFDGTKGNGYYYGDKSDAYIYFNNIYDKYIKLDVMRPVKSSKGSDIKIILSGLNQAFDKITTSEKVFGNRTGIDLGIKTLKVYEAKLIIDDKNYEIVSDNFVNSLKSNNEFVQAISNIGNKTFEEVNELLDRLALNLKQFFKENESTTIKLFIDRKSNKFIKATIDGKIMDFSLNKNDPYYEFNYNNSKSDVKFSGSIQFKKIDKKTKDINLIIKYNHGGATTLGNIDASYSNGKADFFPRVDVKNYVNESDFTDAEIASIYTNLTSKPNYKWISYFVKQVFPTFLCTF